MKYSDHMGALQQLRILVVIDTVEEAQDLDHILRKEFSKYITTAFEYDAVDYIQKIKPQLVIVACNLIDDAEKTIGLIKRNTPPEQLPYILLLCKVSESPEAYELYLRGEVDNFVADRPLYDPYSVIGAVAQGAKKAQERERLGAELGQLHHYMSGMFDSGSDQLKSAAQAFLAFSNMLSEEVGSLKEDFKNINATQGSIDIAYINERLSDFNDGKILPTRKQLGGELQKHKSWFKELKDGYTEHLDQIAITPLSPEPVHILLVDDDEFYREAVSMMFEDLNVRLEGVEGGNAALQYLIEQRPELILLDYEMPDLNGLELLKQLKADENLKEIPVIMLTGFHSREVVRNSISFGASDFIVKPGELEVMIKKIQNTIGKQITN